MGAPLNNQFWKNRTKHGRDVLFQDPELLWEEACQYFQNCDQNTLKSIEFNGKDAKRCTLPLMRAYSKCGLCVFLDCDLKTFNSLEERKDFFLVFTRICQIIYTQKFEGAAAGLLNANLIARDLGLADNSNVSAAVTHNIDELKSLISSIEE